MKTFSLERGGKFSSVAIGSLIGQLSQESADNLLDLIGQYRKIPLCFREEPFFGYLWHDGDVLPNSEGNIPGVFCVELVWTIPFKTTVTVVAANADEAVNRAPEVLYENADRVYDEMTEAFYAFEPNVQHAGVYDAIPVSKRGYASIQHVVINPEDTK